MFKRGLVLCLMLAVASVAQAGAVVDLVSSAPSVPVGGSVTVEVFITQDALATMLPRMVQLDTSASTSGLVFTAPGTSGTIVEMWDYESAGGDLDCEPGDTATCGDAHTIDAVFPVVSSAFGDAAHLLPDATLQMNLVDGVQTKIGEFVLECGSNTGTVTVDVLNSADQGADAGARLFYGFGANIDTIPITTWTAANADITGGSIQLECPDVGCTADLIASNYPCGMSLTRNQSHVLRLEFDDTITAPAAGEIKIQALDAGGAYIGADLSDQFTYTVEGGTVLRIAETGTVLANETWYGIYGSWGNVCEFKMDYPVVIGDVNNSGFTNFSDLSTINQNLTGSSADDDVYDINASGFVNFADISTANGSINAEAPAKPDGHTCTLP